MIERDAEADRRMADTSSLTAYFPYILAYPLSGHAAGALLLFSVLLWISMQSILGIALFAIAAPWVFHYAEGVIDQTAGGRATPPRFGGDMLFLGSNWTAFRPLVGVAIIAAGRVAAGEGAGGAAVLVAGAFLFPGFMLVLAVENSLLAALNPLQLFPTIFRVGRAYLVACAVLALAVAGVYLTLGSGLLFLVLVIAIYLWLMTSHLLGYIAFHRSDQLGFSVKRGPTTEHSRLMEQQEERLAAVLRNIDAARQAGDLAAAGRALFADPGGPASLRVFHEDLFEQMQRRRVVELVHAQGARLISHLLVEKRVAAALDVAETCFDTNIHFQVETPEQAVLLAEAALNAMRDGLFERLLRDADERYRGNPAAVTLAFLAARYQAERKGDDARARELLKPLLAETRHPRHRQINAYARAIAEK